MGRGAGGEGGVRSRKYYFDGGQVEIATHLVYELDSDGKQLRVIKLTDYTAEKVRTLCASPDELRARWADADQRADIIRQLTERGIDFRSEEHTSELQSLRHLVCRLLLEKKK